MEKPLVAKSELLFFKPEYQALHQERLAYINDQLLPLREQAQNPELTPAERAALEQQIWLVTRLKGLSGSTIASALGLNKWQTPYELYCDYMQLSQKPKAQSPALEWGHRLEGVIAEKYAEQTGMALCAPGIVQSRDYPFLLGSLDRAVLGLDGAPYKVLEIKTASANYDTDEIDEDGVAIKAWGSGNVYREDGTLAIKDSQIPKQYLLQVMCYMAVTGLRMADIAVLINTNTFKIFSVDFDADMASAMIKAADKFWCENVLRAIPPERVESDVKNIEAQKDSPVEASAEVAEAVSALRQVQSSIKDLEKQEQTLRDKILGFMGSNDKLTFNGKCLATYGTCKGREAFNAKRFSLEYPELYNSFKEQGQPYRRFLLKK